MSELSGKLQQRLGVRSHGLSAQDNGMAVAARDMAPEPRVDTRHLNAMLAVGFHDGQQDGFRRGSQEAEEFARADRVRMGRTLVPEALDLAAGQVREKLDAVTISITKTATRREIVALYETALSDLAADLRAVANEVRAGRVDLG